MKLKSKKAESQVDYSRLRTLRVLAEVTLAEIAAETELSPGYLSNVLNGVVYPGRRTTQIKLNKCIKRLENHIRRHRPWIYLEELR